MADHRMTSDALFKAGHYNPRQALFGVFDSRKRDALCVTVYIPIAEAKRHARKIGGVTRLGRVDYDRGVFVSM